MKPRFGKRNLAASKNPDDVSLSRAPLIRQAPAARLGEGHGRGNEENVKDVIDIATQAWRARTKMVDALSGEVRDDMKRVFRHIEAILASLASMGFELKDHTNDAFDYGLPLRVVSTQPTAGLSRDTVVETLKPTIYWHDQIVQSGEIILGTPVE